MQIGPYVVEASIGRGASGTVFRGRSQDGKTVAIKLVTRLQGDKRTRFERERRLLGAFGEAEGFVALLDEGESKDGAYLVMPFVGGGTLRARLEDGPLGVAETIGLGVSLSRALGAAHARGIVHRDLKPENVLFTDGGRPLVADLGLAKHFRTDVSGASLSVAVTKAGEIYGTFGYMPPEQMTDAAHVGPATDVFALAAILYECLAGKPAFARTTMLDLISEVEAGRFEPLRRVRPEVPAWLAATIERSLRPDPKERHADANAFGEALAMRRAGWRLRRPWAALPALLVLGAAALVFFGSRAAPPSEPGTAPRTAAAVATRSTPGRPHIAAVDSATGRSALARARGMWRGGEIYTADPNELARRVEEMSGPLETAAQARCLDPELGAFMRAAVTQTRNLYKRERAVSLLQTAFAHDPSDPTRIALASALLNASSTAGEEALALVAPVLAHSLNTDDRAEALDIAVFAELSLKHYERAILRAQEGLVLNPNHQTLNERLAAAQIELRQAWPALETTERIMGFQAEPGSQTEGGRKTLRAEALMLASRWTEAKRLLDEADACKPNDPYLKLDRAVARAQLGDLDGAHADLGDAARIGCDPEILESTRRQIAVLERKP